MEYMQRVLVGLILILLGFGVLYMGSPNRTGQDADLAFAYGFVLLFALGFMLLSMGLLALEGYPGLLSSFVLYFIVGALVAVVRYVMFEGSFSLAEANDPGFWMQLIRRMAIWPLEIVRVTGLLGYAIGY